MSMLMATSDSLLSLVPRALSPLAGGPDDRESGGDCRLLGPFALVVQGALGGLALLSLVYKRYRERPQRPVLIWWFDVSKQLFGSVLVHIANLFMSMLSAGELTPPVALGSEPLVDTGPPLAAEKYRPNPCSFYLLNLGIDTTLGIPILIGLLHLLHRGAQYTALGDPPESLKSGFYGFPPRWTWWFKQSLIYFLGLLGMKFCVLLIFTVFPFIVRIGDWALRWTEGDERVQVFFVMLFFPLIMNALQYWIIDGFIKGKEDRTAIPQDESEAHDHEEGDELLVSDSDEEGKTKVIPKTSAKPSGPSQASAPQEQSTDRYGSTAVRQSAKADGEDTPTTIVGSAKNDSNSHRLGPLDSKEDTKRPISESPPLG